MRREGVTIAHSSDSAVVPGKDRRLVPAAVTVWAGALGGLLWGWLTAVLIGVLAAAAAVVTVWWGTARRRPRYRLLSAAAALFVCGTATAGSTGTRLFHAETDPLRAAAARERDAVLHVTVTERPRHVRTAGDAGLPDGARSVLVAVDVVEAVLAGRRVPSSGRVLLIAPATGWADVLPGQRLSARGSLAPARPHELTVAIGSVRGPPRTSAPAPWWQRGAEVVRAALRTVCAVLPDESAGLLPGLVVGDTSGLSSRIEEEFLDAGMSHLTAVSGSNVAIVCGAVLLLARVLRLGPRGSGVVAGVALLGYVLLVGYEPSVLRAGVMGGVGLLALVLGRRGSALPALSVSVCLLILLDPAMATSMGFTLSVVATAGLVLLAPHWSGALARRGVPAVLSKGLAVPAVAFLATAPVVAGMVGEVSVVSVAANVVASPLVAPVTVLGVVAAASAPFWGAAAEIAVYLAAPGVRGLILIARYASGVPGAVLPWPAGWWGGVLAAVVAVVLVVAVRDRRGRVLLAAAVVALLSVWVPHRVVSPGWPPGNWALVACDVGQGDGLVLATGEPGRAVVVDVGPESGAVDRCLDRLDVERIPLVILSHLHADHAGGLASVLEGRAVGAIAVGPGRTPGWAWRRLTREAAARGVPVVRLAPGRGLAWPRLRLDVLGPRYVPFAQRGGAGAEDATVDGPDGTGPDRDGTAVNNTSLVLRATTPAGSVLLTGDIEPTAQADLLAADRTLAADVLKVPHHGSRSTLPAFLRAVAPDVALISVGADNPYGHPGPFLLRRLTGAGVLVARTDTGGDTAIVPDAGEPAIVRRGPPVSRFGT